MFASQAMAGWMQPAVPRQKPHSHLRVVGSHEAPPIAAQPVGHGPLVSKHPVAPPLVHSQHTGGATQSHLLGPTSWHCDPAGAVGGQGPTQGFVVEAGSK